MDITVASSNINGGQKMPDSEFKCLINQDISALVVDSRGADCHAFANSLRQYFQDVKEAPSAGQVSLILQDYSFDAIFVDLSPQVSDGLAIIKMLRDHEIERKRPTIIATKSSMLTQFSDAARLVGADFCAEHPILLESLLVQVSKTIAARTHNTESAHHKFAFRH